MVTRKNDLRVMVGILPRCYRLWVIDLPACHWLGRLNVASWEGTVQTSACLGKLQGGEVERDGFPWPVAVCKKRCPI